MPTLKRSKFKSTFFFLLTFLVSIDAFSEIKTTTYFSYVFDCNDSLRLTDFVEGEVLRNQFVHPSIIKAKTDADILAFLHQSLGAISPLRSAELIEAYSRLKKDMVLSDEIKIPLPNEPDNILNLPNCGLKPVAVSLQTVTPLDQIKNRLIVNKLVWEKLKLYEQVALLLDFALAEEVREENLIPSRIFTGYWFSNSFEKISTDHWRSLTHYLQLPYQEYRGFKVERFFNENHVSLYKKSKFDMAGTPVVVAGEATFYKDTGHVEFISDVEAFDYEIHPGQWVRAYGVGDKFGNENAMRFFNVGGLKIKSAAYKSTSHLKIKNHILNPLSDYLLNFSYQSPGVLRHIDFEDAKVEIRGKMYEIKYEYQSPANCWLYEDASIGTCSMFERGQILELPGGGQYTVKDTLILHFDRQGFLASRMDKI